MECFRFNFSQSDEEDTEGTEPTPVQDVPERSAFALSVTSKELEKMARETEAEITSTEFCNSDVCIRHVESANAQADIQVLNAERESDSDDKETDCARAISQHSDLIPGVYEGGLKVWECSHDLVEFLHGCKYQFNEKRVLEIGCGAALPGLYALLMGAKSVDFQDYNEEVLRHVTVPNVAANMYQALQMKQSRSPRRLRQSPRQHPRQHARQHTANQTPHVRLADAAKAVTVGFLAGDWGKLKELFTEQLASGKSLPYDVILTSETIYRQSAHNKLLDLIKCCLSPSGVVLLAAKSHYFGVGGSTRSFEQAVQADKSLDSKVVFKSSGSGVIREILEMRWMAT